MVYEVRWIDAGEVRDEHFGAWERNLARPVGARRWFDWLYRRNPEGPGRLALLEAPSPGGPARPVGAAGCAARAFWWRGRTLDAVVLGDLALDPGHRGAAPARGLLRELRRASLAHADLFAAFPDGRAAPLLLDAGGRKLGEARRFVLSLRHRPMLATKIGRPAGLVAGLGLDVARAALLAAGAVRAALEHRLDWLTDADVDDRFDRLWRDARADHGLVGVRDGAFVRWRFLDHPEGRAELAGLVHRRTGVLEGYAALARDGADVRLLDLFAGRPALPHLLALLLGAVARSGAAAVSMRLFGASPLVTCLQIAGFRERPDRAMVVGEPGEALRGTAGPEILDADRWHLTAADESVLLAGPEAPDAPPLGAGDGAPAPALL